MVQNWEHQRTLKEMLKYNVKRNKTIKSNVLNGRAIYLRKIRSALIDRKTAALQKSKNDYKTLYRYEHLKMCRSAIK